MKFLSIAVLVLGMGLVSLNVTPLAGQAKVKMTARTLPKSIRGTWWHCDRQGHYSKIRLTAKKIKVRQRGQHFTETVHSRKADASSSKGFHPYWVFISQRIHGWTNVYGWNQGSGDGDYYKVVHKRYHGKQIRVLKQGGGAGIVTNERDYPTKQIAKHFKSNHTAY